MHCHIRPLQIFSLLIKHIKKIIFLSIFIFISIILFKFFNFLFDHFLLATQGGGDPNPFGGEGNPNPFGGGPTGALLYLDPGLSETDTDKLANYLEEKKAQGARFMADAQIKFTRDRIVILAPHHPAHSLTARFVRNRDPSLFHAVGPQFTPITDTLIASIRSMHQNVELRYR